MVAYQDRISLLSDELLFKIVSLLPFKEAVRTSKLSKRWRLIPFGTSNMEFYENDFVGSKPNPPADVVPVYGSPHLREVSTLGFVDFVLRWISRRYSEDPAGGYKFLLKLSFRPEDHLIQLKRCLRFAIGREIEVLDLDFSNPKWDEDDIENEDHREPITLFQLPCIRDDELLTLQSLRLISCNVPVISPASPHQFHALKSVSLGWITVTPSLLQNLLKQCPFLEDLSMRRCCYDGENVGIYSESLKSLIMEKCCPAEPGILMLPFNINAPKLELFKYSGILINLYIESSNLDMEASLDFCFLTDFILDYGEDLYYNVLLQIGGVKTLTLCSYCLQVIPFAEEPTELIPGLQRLKHLILKASLSRDEFYGITFFLKSCPNLETLTIDLNTPAKSFPDYEFPFPIREHPFLRNFTVGFACVRRKLKKIVIEGFKGTANEVAVLSYLLQDARRLEILQIKISQEKAPDGSSLEGFYVQKVKDLLKLKIANQGLRIQLSRRG